MSSSTCRYSNSSCTKSGDCGLGTELRLLQVLEILQVLQILQVLFAIILFLPFFSLFLLLIVFIEELRRRELRRGAATAVGRERQRLTTAARRTWSTNVVQNRLARLECQF
ncbi:hypothetical protein TYRP_010114 [Tyrophagus putrescentiae]|nr:hypothetical protein TYRP_010114 [Tyrophagus putrescentiae]